jgi:hypothetical protein
MSSSTSSEKLPEDASATARAADVVAGSSVAATSSPREYDVLIKTVFSLFAIGVTVGLVYAWTGYSDRYAQMTEGWHIGQTKLVEVTIVREDKARLACSSDVISGDVHCGYRANGQPFDAHTQDDSHVLSPFNTVKNELFLGAGLWTSPVLQGPLPTERFSAACNFKVLGVVKSVGLRWALNASFDPVKQSVAVGSLTDCVIPK